MITVRHLICVLILSFTSSVHAEDLSVLFLGDSGHHQPKSRFDELQPALADRGISLVYTDKVQDMTLENLRRYDALVVYANIDEIDDASTKAILDYVAGGGGFVPLHCATYCFRNQPELVALMGAQFERHGTGVFQAEIDKPSHELMRGYGGFKSWDETYVHTRHNETDRIVLEYRADQEGREPWTWVRTQGKGRVFYTASGHDSRTWMNRGFQNLIERGIRWAAGKDPSQAGKYLDEKAFPVPKMTVMAADREPFQYQDVGGKIPNYTPSPKWGVQGKLKNLMQKPLDPVESMKHLVVPEGFHVELFASEPQLQGKPICMAWDERGRLWVAETYDYPNELNPPGGGRDRIRICEDTDGDGKADKFTVFAEKLSIPTSITFHHGGAIVQNALETLYLKDTDGDDQADVRKVLVTGWTLGDTHGGVSNFQYGLDNWIWAMQGYNNSEPIAGGKTQQRFRMGFFRMRPDGSEVEFIRSTNNNTWGLGISEDGLIFGSTANGHPSLYMPIPNRYYESVRGWAPSLTLSSIADTHKFSPITGNVRQVDHHGGYTAAAGHAIYTAREYPQEYWNRVAFVNGPTGHLVGSFVLNKTGSDFHSTSPFNLLASDDEWTAPIMSEVGPDGQVWVIDWYNYIVQHNPTPEGFTTGKGQAYETDLRDKKHGRIYRVVANSSRAKPIPNLHDATPKQLVEALKNPTMLVRKHAQRLLVERGEADVVDQLISLVEDKSTDAIGLNVGAMHALWTLHGLDVLDGKHEQASQAVFAALLHPSAGVRRNAAAVLPATGSSVDALLAAKLHLDENAQVRLAATLAFADLPARPESAEALLGMLSNPGNFSDRWLPDAITSASAHNSGVLLSALAHADAVPEESLPILVRVAEHHVRGEGNEDSAELIAGLSSAKPNVIAAVLKGFERGWKPGGKVKLTPEIETLLAETMNRVDVGSKSTLVKLAIGWGSESLSKYAEEISDRLLKQVRNKDATDADRIQSARQLIAFRPEDKNAAVSLLDEVTSRTSPQLSSGILQAMEACVWDGVGGEIVGRLRTMTPSLKQVALSQLLKRPNSTMALLKAAQAGRFSLDDLALDQKQALASHPNSDVKMVANELLSQGGSLPNADRENVL
ncbi:MAG: putative membrane-bound dehydrogenase-like protein, partial [Mariniblastus sp.]